MKDFADREIKHGDIIIFTCARFRGELQKGTVKTIGKKCLRIVYEDKGYRGMKNGGISEINVYPNQTLIIQSEELQEDNTIKTINRILP